MSLALPRKLLINLKYYLATRTSYGKNVHLHMALFTQTKRIKFCFQFRSISSSYKYLAL